MPYCDIVGVSYYPFIQGGTTATAAAFKWLSEKFENYDKPYAIVETGEAAQQLTFPSSGQKVQGTPEKQYAYAIQLLYLAQSRNTEFVIWFIHRVHDALPFAQTLDLLLHFGLGSLNEQLGKHP